MSGGAEVAGRRMGGATDEPITLAVSLGPKGLCVTLPSGRALNISADEAGARFLQKMLRDAEDHRRYDIQQSGYIRAFPTQEITDIWERAERNRATLAQQARSMLAEDLQAKAEAKALSARNKAKQAKRVWAKRGIDSSKIKINL